MKKDSQAQDHQSESSPSNTPLVSVITVVKNGVHVLERTIQSVLSQTYPNLEFIVIDGASTDGTVEIIRHYEQQIHVWRSEPDSGVSEAFNKGIDAAKGDWINFLNAGDQFMKPDTLQQVSQYFPCAPIVIGFAKFGQKLLPKRKVSNQSPLSTKAMISHQAAFVHRSVFEAVGTFNESYRLRMDYDFWLRSLPHYPLYMMDQILVDYDPHGMSGKPENIRLFYAEEKRANLEHRVPFRLGLNSLAALKSYIKRAQNRRLQP